MRLPRKFLKFDYDVHFLLGLLIAFCILLLLVSPYATALGLSIVMLLTGFWQLTSALIMTIFYKDKKRLYYLSAVAIYLMLLFIPRILVPYYYNNIIFLSPVFAVWYAYLTYKDATYRTPSFWDLEF